MGRASGLTDFFAKFTPSAHSFCADGVFLCRINPHDARESSDFLSSGCGRNHGSGHRPPCFAAAAYRRSVRIHPSRLPRRGPAPAGVASRRPYANLCRRYLLPSGDHPSSATCIRSGFRLDRLPPLRTRSMARYRLGASGRDSRHGSLGRMAHLAPPLRRTGAACRNVGR